MEDYFLNLLSHLCQIRTKAQKLSCKKNNAAKQQPENAEVLTQMRPHFPPQLFKQVS